MIFCCRFAADSANDDRSINFGLRSPTAAPVSGAGYLRPHKRYLHPRKRRSDEPAWLAYNRGRAGSAATLEEKHMHGKPGLPRREVLALAALAPLAGAPGSARAAAGPDGQLIWGVHISLAPIWFDPADISGVITPFMVLYGLHDAMVKPMPGQALAPSLAESVKASEDGRTYDFVIRDGAQFHTGDPVTSADVKFSFDRYRGVAHDLLQSRVAEVETPDPRHVR